MWDFEDWCMAGFLAFLVILFGGGITCSVMESKKYADLCHAKGGEVVSGANQKLCRDGDVLLNVYKEDSK
ncbi:hypothetical protein uav_034 [Pseudomonas phage UAVern]|uniref:Uncharacterized protein n=1 Tax=Pseudomonas phage UAVern TaxID=2856997 RepID=A0A975UUE5_9CAUD|nr:hypothetical protein uav_034 [Pseudomonas phage UAVern]